MKIKLLTLGKLKRRPVVEIADDYAHRIKHFHTFELVELPDEPIRSKSEVQVALAREAESIQRALKKDACLVILDEKGKMYSSVDLAWELGQMFQGPYSEIVFLIGGAFGLDPEIKSRGQYSLSLSKLTLPHELARVLCLEQIYRALTILRNVPYHHE